MLRPLRKAADGKLDRAAFEGRGQYQSAAHEQVVLESVAQSTQSVAQRGLDIPSRCAAALTLCSVNTA